MKHSSGLTRFLQTPRANLWIFLVALFGLFAWSATVRFQQFESWKQNPGAYFVGERPMMTTLDAPFWLRWAREYNEGIYGTDELRYYPDYQTDFKTPPEAFQEPEPGVSDASTPPLLSWLIAQFAPVFGGNYYLTGTLLIPILASLFILPLGYYFYLMGVPAGGLIGGFVGTFCAEYLMRSSIGRIDTDMLNLFFPALAAVWIYWSARSRTPQAILGFATLAGITLWAFQWWYGKPGFTLAFFGVLIVTQALYKVAPRWIVLSSLLFILFAGPATFVSSAGSVESFLGRYFKIEAVDPYAVQDNTSATPATFPNVMTTISEAERIPLGDVLPGILNSSTLGWVGLLAFAMLAVFRWKQAVPLLPMLLLGLLGFQSARRFLMFLAPFLGVGLGFLLTIGIQIVWEGLTQKSPPSETTKKTKKEARKEARKDTLADASESSSPAWWQRPELRDVVLYGGALGICLALMGNTAIRFVPGPSIPTPLYSTFEEVRKRTPENAALYTWWDFGYALTDATQRAVFHDGGSQFSPKTYFVAKSFIGTSQEEMQHIIHFLGSQGNRGLEDNNTSPEALMQAVLSPTTVPPDPVYILYTADMIGKYSALSSIGSWDLAKGGNQVKGFQHLRCANIENNILNCENAKIDLNQGTINGRFPLKEVVQIMSGEVVGQKGYGRQDGYYLQILMANRQQFSDVYLLERDVFASNFNQMFLLGRYDRSRFEEVFNRFPYARLFRVKE